MSVITVSWEFLNTRNADDKKWGCENNMEVNILS